MVFKIGTNNPDIVTGSNSNDRIYGLRGNDRIYGYGGSDLLDDKWNIFEGGNDRFYGGSGNDSLYGYSGNDYLNGGSGADKMYGGTGNDRFVVDGASDSVIEYSGQGTDRVYSYISSYTLPTHIEHLSLRGSAVRGFGNSVRNVISGNSKNNSLYGRGGHDSLYGSSGNDYVHGGSGNDYLHGGSGNDTLVGSTGDDTLVGSTGRDIMYDGAGKDKFKYFSTSESLTGSTRRDQIKNFDRGFDKIDLAAIDANKNVLGNQAFKFIGTRRFSGTTGEVRYYRSGSSLILQADVHGDGNRTAEFEIDFNNTSFIAASDIIL